MRSSRPLSVVSLAVLALASCAGSPRPQVVTHEKTFSIIEWTEEERSKDVAVRTLRTTPEASHHLVLVNATERPHYHENHDQTVFVLSGRIKLRIAERTMILEAGHVVDIPRGVVHCAAPEPPGRCEAYVIYTPAFDGKDRKLVEGL